MILNSYAMNLLGWESDILTRSLGPESIHKDLWPLEESEMIGYLIMFVVSALANTAGIGGGSIMTPVLVLLFYFETRTAVPLSQVIIFGGAAVAIMLKIKNRHPTRDRPLIFYKLIVVVQAPILLGTFFGALLNAIFPSWLIEFILTSVLAFMFYSTTKKAMMLYQKETKLISKDRLLPIQTEMNLLPDSENSQKGDRAVISIDTEKLEFIISEEKRVLPVNEVLMIVGIWLIVVLFTLMKGGSVPSIIGIQECSAEYFILITVFVCVLLGIFVFNLKSAIKLTEEKDELNYDWDENDIKWTRKNALTFGLLSICVGFVAGLIGIAGGLMMIPLMLWYGVGPEQAAATSSFTVVFTSSVAILHYISSGLLHAEYGTAVLCVSLLGAYTGISIVKRIIDKYHRPSIIVFILAFIMAIVVILVPSYGVTNLISDYNDGTAEFGFRELCGA